MPTDHPLPDYSANPPERAAPPWVEDVCRGARLFVLTITLAMVLINGIAFLLPFFAVPREGIQWLSAIRVAAIWPFLHAVFLLTRPPDGDSEALPPRPALWRLRVVAVLSALVSLLVFLLAIGPTESAQFYALTLRWLVDFVFCLLLFAFLTEVAARFAAREHAHRMRLAFWLVILNLVVLDIAVRIPEFDYQELTRIWMRGVYMARIIIFFWIMTAIWRFARQLP